MKGEILSVGTELLMGELADTNGSWVAARLPALGIQLQYVTIVGDNLDMLADAFSRGLQRSDIIFTTGGLGPTQDDLTREGVAKAVGETPVVQQEVVRDLERYFQGRGTAMPATNIKQAYLIPSARFIPNPNGTAPGWWTQRNGKIIVNMPGPPGEMHPMFEDQVAPKLREIVKDEVTITRNIKTIGLGEGAVDETVSEFFGKENPYLGIYAKQDGVHLRIIARAKDAAAAQKLIQPVEQAIVSRLAPYVWGYDEETPEQAVGQALVQRGLTLATMESVSGGYLVNSITEVPDCASFFKGGVVAVDDGLKIANGVPAEVIQKHGAVSQQAATAMAQAIRRTLGADFGIGVVGMVGSRSDGGRQVGLAYLAIAAQGQVKEMELRIPPRRAVMKRRLANTALIELKRMINAL
ncbi:MAG: CinA family nicotinamide mononucleotide deamidase-related protein [Dehalococcoidia bacterium]|nr:CinA family nicotinamide mononucleotide deamidase-related protein [Dehalococcoidia bacterium]MSQ16238.1 CinA family nicotinamide mononucleotide deamidase-related protein [Dehalococcoidia bacterium]